MSFLSKIPVIGWVFAFFLAFLLAIPLWIIWQIIAEPYFYFLPMVWIDIGFWDTVFMIWFVTLMRSLLNPVPLLSFKPVINTVEKNTKEKKEQ